MRYSTYSNYNSQERQLKQRPGATHSKIALKYGQGEGDPAISSRGFGFDSLKKFGIGLKDIGNDDIPDRDDFFSIEIESSGEDGDGDFQKIWNCATANPKPKSRIKPHLKTEDTESVPLNLFDQFYYGRQNKRTSATMKKATERSRDNSLLRLIKQNLRKFRCKKRKVTEDVGVKDVGDEDQGIFGSDEPDKKRVWNLLAIIRILLRIFITIDYLYAWYEHGQYRLAAAENEYAYLQKMYNCRKRSMSGGIGDKVIEYVRGMNAFLSFLVLFVSNEQNTTICAYWMSTRWALALMRALRYFWLTRFISDEDLKFEMTCHFIIICIFDLLGMFLVCYFYYEFSDLIRSRVNRLRSGRVLNLEIEAKHLDEFSQRKAAVRYAGTYQSTLLIKKQIREALYRGNKWDLDDPRPEECKFALEEGINAYKYFRGIPVLKIEETEQKLVKKIRVRKLKHAEERIETQSELSGRTENIKTWIKENDTTKF